MVVKHHSSFIYIYLVSGWIWFLVKPFWGKHGLTQTLVPYASVLKEGHEIVFVTGRDRIDNIPFVT